MLDCHLFYKRDIANVFICGLEYIYIYNISTHDLYNGKYFLSHICKEEVMMHALETADSETWERTYKPTPQGSHISVSGWNVV